MSVARLFALRGKSSVWVATDAGGALVMFPRFPGGWELRVPYRGPVELLSEVPPQSGRPSGWPAVDAPRVVPPPPPPPRRKLSGNWMSMPDEEPRVTETTELGPAGEDERSDQVPRRGRTSGGP